MVLDCITRKISGLPGTQRYNACHLRVNGLCLLVGEAP